jgi:hypothetical protein
MQAVRASARKLTQPLGKPGRFEHRPAARMIAVGWSQLMQEQHRAHDAHLTHVMVMRMARLSSAG